MTGKLMFVPDSWVVVPKEPTEEMVNQGVLSEGDTIISGKVFAKNLYKDMLGESPPLTTPPVLRWEGDTLKCGNMQMAHAWGFNGQFWYLVTDRHRSPLQSKSIEEARRAAEKALGFPEGLIIPEV